MSLVASGFDRPVYAASAPGDPDRLYVVEQHTGRIVILDTTSGARVPGSFLDLPDASLSGGSEQGVIGLAFHPDYATNGKVFIAPDAARRRFRDSQLHRSSTDPNQLDAASANTVLVLDKDSGQQSHNAGWIDFGPDGNFGFEDGSSLVVRNITEAALLNDILV